MPWLPGNDLRIRLPTPPTGPMTNGFGVRIIVPVVPLLASTNIDGKVIARASPLPPF